MRGGGCGALRGGESGDDFNRERIVEEAKKLFDKEASRSDIPVQLWLDGVDHQPAGPRIPEALDVARQALPEAEILFSTLPAFAKAVDRFRAKLPVFEGELIDVARAEGGYIFLISHCLSSHYPMKLANDRCQNALERWAEPFYAWASLLGKAPAKSYLDIAWQYLLQNHAHDSICGCSIDQVHKDTEYRYDQCALIAREVLADCQAALAPAQDKAANTLTLTVANALASSDTRVVTVEFDYPSDFGRRGLTGFSDDRIPCFDLIDSGGRKVACQMHRYLAPEEYLGLPAWGQEVQRVMKVRVFFEASFDGISAKSFAITPSETRHRDMGTQMTGSLAAENEHIAVEVNADGTLDLTDKASGRRFEGLCVFEDTGDMGDGWYHVKPVHNETYLSTGFPTSISVTDDGSLVTTFRIEKTLCLPAEHDWALMRRGETKKPVTLRMDVILRKGARYVECVTTLDNTVKDHRLRVLFPSRVAGKDYFANQPFAFVTRRRGVDASTADWKENDTEESNFHGIVGAADVKGGLAVVAGEGLHEVAVKADADATIAVTLMRAFKRTVLPPYIGRGELQQKMTFAWRIVPFTGTPDFVALANLQQEFHLGVRVRQTRGSGPEAGTFAALKKGLAMLSALKPAADGCGIIVRLYNPTGKAVSDALTFSTAFTSAVEVNHAEERLKGAKPLAAGCTFKIDLPPHRIRTWRLRFARR